MIFGFALSLVLRTRREKEKAGKMRPWESPRCGCELAATRCQEQA